MEVGLVASVVPADGAVDVDVDPDPDPEVEVDVPGAVSVVGDAGEVVELRGAVLLADRVSVVGVGWDVDVTAIGVAGAAGARGNGVGRTTR